MCLFQFVSEKEYCVENKEFFHMLLRILVQYMYIAFIVKSLSEKTNIPSLTFFTFTITKRA